MNIVMLLGNLARDPEVKYTPSGQSVCEATICVSKKWRTESGEDKERTAFVSLVIWGKRGEAFAKHHRKGSKACVRGELVQDTWDDKETGKKRDKTRVQVEDWDFAVGKPADGQQDTPRPKPAHMQPPPQNFPPRPIEDDVPF